MDNTVLKLESLIRGEDVFIVGGGSSILGMNLQFIQGKKIITINDGYDVIPPDDVVAMFWCDASWADSRYKELDKHPCKLRFTKRQKVKAILANGAYGSTILQHTGDYGYDSNKYFVRGNNGGAQVLNLIFNMRPKRIFLLGYDMRRINNKSHFHNKHILAVNDDIYTSLFIPSINSMAEEFTKVPNAPKIYNCSAFSALKCFPFFDLNTILDSTEEEEEMATSIDRFKQKQQQIIKQAPTPNPTISENVDKNTSGNDYNPPVIHDYKRDLRPLPSNTNSPHKGIAFGTIDTSIIPETVIIVASGTSLKGFDVNRLRGKGFIITVNDSGKEVLFADAWVTIDPWGIHIPQGSTNPVPQLPPNTFKGKIYAGVSENYNTPTCKIVNGNIKIDPRVTFLRRLVHTNNPDASKENSYHYRLSEDPGCVSTGNSGYAAFNLAYLLKPRNIVMLGIDGGSGYWFTNSKTNRPLDGLNGLFTSSLPQIQAAHINVINGSINSAVTCFPRYNVDTALSMI